MELVDLQENVELKQRFKSVETCVKFWKLVKKNKFPSAV